MKPKQKIILAVALLGLTLSPAFGQTAITVGNQALLNGWDFDNILGSSISQPSRGRYSDVFGNNNSPTALTAPGGIYFDGTFGSDNWGSVAKNATGDINRDILTRSGTGGSFDLGGLTGTEGAAWFNNANVGTAAMNTFSINVHTMDGVNTFEDLTLSLYGRDIGNTAGGVTINWGYSLDGGLTAISTSLFSTFMGNVFTNSTVDFSSITALNGMANVYLIGTVVESQVSAVLSLDNIAVYGFAAIPEPSTYAAILGAFAIGVAVLRRRRSEVAA